MPFSDFVIHIKAKPGVFKDKIKGVFNRDGNTKSGDG